MNVNDNKLVASALAKLNIAELNQMQKAALEQSRKPENIILLSPTGSGKTLAFLLPLIESLNAEQTGIQALVLVPSRELALQIETVFKSLDTQFKCCSCYGGHPIAQEKKSIEGNKPAVIIGTPGRIADHIYKGNFDPQTISTLIIDEFDKSLEFGFLDQMFEIIEQLPGLQKRFLISATDAKELPRFAGADNAVKLNFLEQDTPSESRLTMKKVLSPAKDKIETLHLLLCSLGSSSSIVFCNHREAVERIADLLADNGLYTERFHGGMEQPDRERALYKFRNQSCHVLVSTDLAARGLDIPEVEHIIHYHLPVQKDAFVHRNGRTARWQAQGTSYVILSEQERVPDYFDTDIDILELPTRCPRVPKPLWATLYISKGRKDKISKMDIAGLLHKKGGLAREEVGVIDVRDHYCFVAVRRDKLKSLMNLIRGEKLKGVRVLIEEAK